jgi:hypothetical protein
MPRPGEKCLTDSNLFFRASRNQARAYFQFRKATARERFAGDIAKPKKMLATEAPEPIAVHDSKTN